MSLFLTEFDRWCDEYFTASEQQQHQMLIEVLSQPIDPAYAKEIDLGMTVIDHQDLLLNHKRSDDALYLIDLLQTQQPAFYGEEFHYFDGFLVQYHLYQNDVPEVTKSLTRFKADPISGIDNLIEVIEDLQFYDITLPLLNLCRSVYATVESDEKILPGTGIEFARPIFADAMEQACDRIKQGKSLDWTEIKSQIEPYGFDLTPDLQAKLNKHLTTSIATSADFATQFEQDRDAVLGHLLVDFCRYMHDRYQMSFVCAHMIWSSLINFLHDRNPSQKQAANNYFSIDKNQLDQYITRKVTGFLSRQQSTGFAVLWGIPHIYDFLLANQIISVKVYDKVIAITNDLSIKLIKICSRSLWRYSFVHRWPKPDSMTAEAFTAEALQFAVTFHQVTPLNDQPTEEKTFHLPVEPTVQSPQSTPSFPMWKSKKPRKSALQEAGDLQKKNKTEKSKKSHRKGFG